MELIEDRDFGWLRSFIADIQSPAYDQLSARRPDIHRMMSRLVKPWREHYIQYNTTPEIDSFYEMLGVLHAQQMFGHDSFPGDTLFGAKTFDLYRATVGVLVGWARKHLEFCTLLLKQHPQMRWENAATIWRTWDEMAMYVAAALDTEEREALQALRVLVLSAENCSCHCARGAGSLAPFIAIGDRWIIESMSGILSDPFFFMLRELHRLYPSDWDRALDSREGIFRSQLYQMFPSERFVRVEQSVALRENGRKMTDIDAAIFDRRSGVLALFQLKWQDSFGDSMRKRKSKKANMTREAGEWIERTLAWMSANTRRHIASALHLGQVEIRECHLFVIGRYFAHFSGDALPDDRAAWGLWPQVCRLLSECRDRDDPLGWLYRRLREDGPHMKKLSSFGELTEEVLDFDGLRVIVHPPAGTNAV